MAVDRAKITKGFTSLSDRCRFSKLQLPKAFQVYHQMHWYKAAQDR